MLLHLASTSVHYNPLSINASTIFYLFLAVIYLFLDPLLHTFYSFPFFIIFPSTIIRDFPHQLAHTFTMPRVCDKDAPSRDLFVKSWIFMMLWFRLKPAIWLLHPSVSAIEKIRIVFIDEPLTGFGLICDPFSAMAFATNCNFTIVYCFRVGFPKMKWA